MMKIMAIIFLGLASLAISDELGKESSPEIIRALVSNSMNRIIIPSIRMTNATIVDFANTLVDESVKHDPEHRGISIIVNMNNADGGTNCAAPKLFTINEQNIRYRDLLTKACELADCEWSQTTIPIVRPKTKRIVEPGSCGYVAPLRVDAPHR